jgi:hypothetical protein
VAILVILVGESNGKLRDAGPGAWRWNEKTTPAFRFFATFRGWDMRGG